MAEIITIPNTVHLSRITIFGANPKYLEVLENKSVVPSEFKHRIKPIVPVIIFVDSFTKIDCTGNPVNELSELPYIFVLFFFYFR